DCQRLGEGDVEPGRAASPMFQTLRRSKQPPTPGPLNPGSGPLDRAHVVRQPESNAPEVVADAIDMPDAEALFGMLEFFGSVIGFPGIVVTEVLGRGGKLPAVSGSAQGLLEIRRQHRNAPFPCPMNDLSVMGSRLPAGHEIAEALL